MIVSMYVGSEDCPKGQVLAIEQSGRKFIDIRFKNGSTMTFSGTESSHAITAARALAKELTDAADKAESGEAEELTGAADE